MGSIDKVVNESGMALPGEYCELVAGLERSALFQYGNRQWEIATASELLEPIEVLGIGAKPLFSSLALFTSMWAKFTGASSLYSPSGFLPIERVDASFVIGSGDGDYLYLDPADHFSVWIYHHDGSDVERVAMSFKVWLRRARRIGHCSSD